MGNTGFTVIYRLKAGGRQAATTVGFAAQLAKANRAVLLYPPGRATAGARGRAYAVRASSMSEATALVQGLRDDPRVERAYGAPPRSLAAVRNASPTGGGGTLGLSWRNEIHLPQAAALGQWAGTSSVSVAIVDSGVDGAHPALKDVKHVDHLVSKPSSDDPTGHGTHVAGLIAAQVAGGWPSEGVATPVVSATMYRGITSTYDPLSYLPALQAALAGAKVVNLSLSGEEEDPEETDEIALAIQRGVVVIAAVGNTWEFDENVVPYPASLPDVIGVGAVDGAGAVAPFSARGPFVDVAAPGVDIGSTVPTYSVPTIQRVANPAGANMSGTSMAAPIVSGLVARMLAHSPKLTLADIHKALRGAPCGCTTDEVGLGRVDAEATMRNL